MKKLLILSTLSLFISINTQAQFWKKKKEEAPAAADSSKPEQKEEPKKGGNFFQKIIGKVAKGAGNLAGSASGALESVETVGDADVIVAVGTNIYSKDLGLMLPDLIGKEWINNGDFTMLQLAGKDGFKMYKYNGNIKVNGKELKHFAMGIHSVTENPNAGNKKITFEKNGTVEAGFEIPVPAKNIKLVSINGQTKNVSIDLTKDVVLEFANFSTEPSSLIRVDIVTTQIGIRTLSLVAYVKPAAKVTIPAAAFKNIDNGNKFNFKNSYISIADQLLVKPINITGNIPTTQMVSTGSNDGMWVTVTNSNENSTGINFELDKTKVFKKNAAFAKPLSFAKTISVSSFYTYGETYTSGTKENKFQGTQTTKTINFPDIPNEYLDDALSKLYANITKVIKEEMGSNILPENAVTNSPSYANTMKFMADDLNNSSQFMRAHKGLHPIKTLSSVTYMNYGESRLIKETKADALLKASLIFRLSWDKVPMITPYLDVELIGESNGDFRSYTGSTKYFTINITGDGYELKNKEAVDFPQVFQLGNLATKFQAALKELKAKEAANTDYEVIWKLQQ